MDSGNDITDFLHELLGTPHYLKDRIRVRYSKYTGQWRVENKSFDTGNLKVYRTYGTQRMNAYKIMEQTLNLRDARVFDYFENEKGTPKEGADCASCITKDLMRFGRASMTEATFAFTA